MDTLIDRIVSLTERASALQERLEKAMRSRGVDGDGDGVYNEGAAPPAKPPRKAPAKRPQKAPQRAEQDAGAQPAGKPRRARGAQQQGPASMQPMAVQEQPRQEN